MPRPPKSLDEKRVHRLPQPRVTVSEMLKIEQNANAMGVSVSEFIVRRAVGYKVPNRAEPIVPIGTLSELNRIGINLNQIAKHANATGEISAAIIPTMTLIRDTLERICRRLEEEEARNPPPPEPWEEYGPE